jgi:hypothetical protein
MSPGGEGMNYEGRSIQKAPKALNESSCFRDFIPSALPTTTKHL